MNEEKYYKDVFRHNINIIYRKNVNIYFLRNYDKQ